MNALRPFGRIQILRVTFVEDRSSAFQNVDDFLVDNRILNGSSELGDLVALFLVHLGIDNLLHVAHDGEVRIVGDEDICRLRRLVLVCVTLV